LHCLFIWREIWNEDICNTCRHSKKISKFLKLFYYFEPAPNWMSILPFGGWGWGVG